MTYFKGRIRTWRHIVSCLNFQNLRLPRAWKRPSGAGLNQPCHCVVLLTWLLLSSVCSRTGKQRAPIRSHPTNTTPFFKEHQAQHWPPVSQYSAVQFFAAGLFLALGALALAVTSVPHPPPPATGILNHSVPSGLPPFPLLIPRGCTFGGLCPEARLWTLWSFICHPISGIHSVSPGI